MCVLRIEEQRIPARSLVRQVLEAPRAMTIAEALAVEQITPSVRMSLDLVRLDLVRLHRIPGMGLGRRIPTRALKIILVPMASQATIADQAGSLLRTTGAHRLRVLRRRTAEAVISGQRRRHPTIALRRPMVVEAELPRTAAAGLPVEDPLAVVAPQPLRQATVPAAEAASTATPTIPADVANLVSIPARHAAFGRRFFEQFIAGESKKQYKLSACN